MECQIDRQWDRIKRLIRLDKMARPKRFELLTPRFWLSAARAGGVELNDIRSNHLFARLGHRFIDLSINLFTSGQPSATVMVRPSSLLDWP